MNSPHQRGAPQRQLTVFDGACIIVGIIIGAGFYQSSGLVAANVGGPGQLMVVWVLGGIFILAGAMCYSELAAAFPYEGGEYVFITKAYGRRLGFLFAWAELWIIKPASIGAMAYIFADYAYQWSGSTPSRAAYIATACAPVVVLAIINSLGVKSGKWTQNALTVAKVLGLAAVFLAAMLLAPTPDDAPTAAPRSSNFALAMVFVMFAYGGWNDLSLVSAEIRDPQKNILRALLTGTGAVVLIYLLLTAAFLRGLGFDGLANSGAPASDLLSLCVGPWGGKAISALICVSCLGAINGMLFTCPRVYYALGAQHRLYAWLGRWNATFDAPVRAIVLQSIVTLGLVIGFGMYEDGFSRLVLFTTPFFFFFFLLVGISLFVLRVRDPSAERPYRVSLFPIPPVIFCLGCAFMLYSSVDYMMFNVSQHETEGFFWESLWAIALAATGIVASFFDPPLQDAGIETD